MPRRFSRLVRHPLGALAVLLGLGPAWADPGYYVARPYTQPQQWSTELRYWTVKQRRGGPAVLWPELALSYGFSERWTSTLLASYEGTRDEAVRLGTWNWINQVRLDDGQGDWDLALHTQLIKTGGEAHGHAVELGLVTQTEWQLARVQANLIVEHGWGDLARAGTELKYQWQLSWPLQPGWRAGMQGFGELGNWRRWKPAERQSHRIGPSLQADWTLGTQRSMHVEAAWLLGKTYGRSGNMFSATARLLF